MYKDEYRVVDRIMGLLVLHNVGERKVSERKILVRASHDPSILMAISPNGLFLPK